MPRKRCTPGEETPLIAPGSIGLAVLVRIVVPFDIRLARRGLWRILAHRDRRTEGVEIGGVAVVVGDEAAVRQLVPDVAAVDDFSVHLTGDIDRAVVRYPTYDWIVRAGSLSRIHPIRSIDNMILA